MMGSRDKSPSLTQIQCWFPAYTVQVVPFEGFFSPAFQLNPWIMPLLLHSPLKAVCSLWLWPRKKVHKGGCTSVLLSTMLGLCISGFYPAASQLRCRCFCCGNWSVKGWSEGYYNGVCLCFFCCFVFLLLVACCYFPPDYFPNCIFLS